MKPNSKTWTKTRYSQLYRHSSGTFYARLTVGGKKTWRSLKTELLSIAKPELDKLLKGEAERSELMGDQPMNAHLTMGEAEAIRIKQMDNDPRMKSATRKYWKQIAAAVRKNWDGFADLEARKVTPAMCQSWAGKLAKTASSTRFNNSLSFVRQLFEIAITQGARVASPTKGIKRVRVKSKDLSSQLPTKELFVKWIVAIRGAGGRFSQDAGDFVEFLAYSGVRKGEAKFITWNDVDQRQEEIIVREDPVETTKNSELRRVPIIPAMSALLARIRARRPDDATSAPILRVNEAQKSMDNAGEKLKMRRITHHDLRHFFATICMESGVDIPTFSKWLGHKDGGALALKVYGHLRNEHSRAAAKKVLFSVPAAS